MLNRDDLIYENFDTEGYVRGAIQPRGSVPCDILGDAFLNSVDAVSNTLVEDKVCELTGML